MCSWSGKREKVIRREERGEKRKKERRGKVKEEREEGREGHREEEKERKEKKGRIYTSTLAREAPLPWHLKLPTLRGPLLDLAGQACWWDPTLGPGHPLPPGQDWLHNPSVEAVQEASHMG